MYRSRFRCLWIMIAAFPLVLWSSVSYPCTTFLIAEQGQAVVGKSHDWTIGDGLVLINKRGVKKRTLVFSGTSAEWTSKYASVTFNPWGREFSSSGMNEVGLVAELMSLPSTVYPASYPCPTVTELQWVQYVLDNYQTVAELVQDADNIRVTKAYTKAYTGGLHYLVCDPTTACAAFEYLKGKLVISSGADLQVKTLANDTYGESLAHLAQFTGFGGDKPIPTDSSSLSRFVRASAMTLDGAQTKNKEYAFSILDSVKINSHSKWNLVYLPQDRTVYFRTAANNKIKSIVLDAFDLDCTSPVPLLDINTDAKGDVQTLFVDYSGEKNRQLVEVALSVFDFLPPGALELLASYPEQTTCTLSKPAGDGPFPTVDAGANAGGDLAPPVPVCAVTTPSEEAGGCQCAAAAGGNKRGPIGSFLVLLGLLLGGRLLLRGLRRVRRPG